MSPFSDFERTYGPAENCENPIEESIQAYEGVLPAELIHHWREAGWCSYGKGLLWVTDPKQFDGIVEDWVDLGPGRPVVFLRTAFAHLYFWHGQHVYSLDVQCGSLSQVTQKPERMFTLLCDPEIKERILKAGLYQQALPRLGPPARNECYGFEPALALGGPGTADTIRRVRIREHLALLAQINQG